MVRGVTTFIGPLSKMAGEEGGGKTLKRSWGFLVVQGKNDPLRLMYDTQAEAQSSRRQLLSTRTSHHVPTTKLLAAISTALKQVSSAPSHELSMGE